MKLLTETAFIVTDILGDGNTYYVVAPPGYSFRDGRAQIDPKEYRSPSPEWGSRQNAHHFKSHRAAARVRNVCGTSAKILRVEVR